VINKRVPQQHYLYWCVAEGGGSSPRPAEATATARMPACFSTARALETLDRQALPPPPKQSVVASSLCSPTAPPSSTPPPTLPSPTPLSSPPRWGRRHQRSTGLWSRSTPNKRWTPRWWSRSTGRLQLRLQASPPRPPRSCISCVPSYHSAWASRHRLRGYEGITAWEVEIQHRVVVDNGEEGFACGGERWFLADQAVGGAGRTDARC
jgi:hypothetical protein